MAKKIPSREKVTIITDRIIGYTKIVEQRIIKSLTKKNNYGKNKSKFQFGVTEQQPKAPQKSDKAK